MPVSEQEVPVLVVGGSLVGLTTSVLLASHGVRHMLIERHRGTAIHPRAASFHQRTMEIFRSVGLQRAVEAAAEREFVQNGAIISVDALSGKELACFYRSFNEGVEGLSPTSRLFITQVGLEPVLRDRARELGADHHYATELAGFEQDAAGVVAVLRPRDGGPERRVRARYLVAADGAHSFVRQQLGIGMAGRGSFADCVTIYFKADVRALIGGSQSQRRLREPARAARVLQILDHRGRRVSSRSSRPSTRTAPATATSARTFPRPAAPHWCARRSGYRPSSPSRSTTCSPGARPLPRRRHFAGGASSWPATPRISCPPPAALAATPASRTPTISRGSWRWCSREPPARGCWTAIEPERKPQCELIVEQAYARYIKRVDPSLPATNLAPLLDDAAIELGSVYGSDAILDEEERRGAAALLEDPHNPSGRPGTRVPHIMLQRNGVAGFHA